jgi:RNA polymerase sigma-70 factor (ECF subfamily)
MAVDTENMNVETLVEVYGDKIVKYCYSLLWDYHEAQDATQDVFVAAMKQIDTLRDRQNTKAWLYRIAHNRCMDLLRRKKRTERFGLRSAGGSDYHEDTYDFGISRALQVALNTLWPSERALVYNRAVDEMDYAELALIYGTKAETLRKRYERARKKLEETLGGGEQYGT